MQQADDRIASGDCMHSWCGHLSCLDPWRLIQDPDGSEGTAILRFVLPEGRDSRVQAITSKRGHVSSTYDLVYRDRELDLFGILRRVAGWR